MWDRVKIYNAFSFATFVQHLQYVIASVVGVDWARIDLISKADNIPLDRY